MPKKCRLIGLSYFGGLKRTLLPAFDDISCMVPQVLHIAYLSDMCVHDQDHSLF